MKNYEKYADEIRNIKSQTGWCDSFAKPKILAPIGKSCGNTACGHCAVLTLRLNGATEMADFGAMRIASYCKLIHHRIGRKSKKC